MDSLIIDKVSIGTESFPTLISTTSFLTCEVPAVGKGFYSEQGLPHLLYQESFSPVWAIWWSTSRELWVKAFYTFITCMRFLPIVESLVFNEMGTGMTSLPTLWIHRAFSLSGSSSEPLAERSVWRSYHVYYSHRGSFQYGSSTGQQDVGSDWNIATFIAPSDVMYVPSDFLVVSRTGGQTDMSCRLERHLPHLSCSLPYAQLWRPCARRSWSEQMGQKLGSPWGTSESQGKCQWLQVAAGKECGPCLSTRSGNSWAGDPGIWPAHLDTHISHN